MSESFGHSQPLDATESISAALNWFRSSACHGVSGDTADRCVWSIILNGRNGKQTIAPEVSGTSICEASSLLQPRLKSLDQWSRRRTHVELCKLAMQLWEQALAGLSRSGLPPPAWPGSSGRCEGLLGMWNSGIRTALAWRPVGYPFSWITKLHASSSDISTWSK